MSSVYTQQDVQSGASDYATTQFLINQAIRKIPGALPVQVISCTNSGGVAGFGFVNVKPLIQQMDGNFQIVPNGVGTIYQLPYVRIQGGVNAIILDPVAGDIGLAMFCSRDISLVKQSRVLSAPGSRRINDWADGVYVGGILNLLPSNYLAFTQSGIVLLSTQKVTIQAPTVAVQGNMTVSGNLNIGGTTTGTGDGTFAGIDVQEHTHSGVTTGGSDTGPPVP